MMNISNVSNVKLSPALETKPVRDRKSPADFEGELLEAGMTAGAVGVAGGNVMTSAMQPGIVTQNVRPPEAQPAQGAREVSVNSTKGQGHNAEPQTLNIDRSLLNQGTAASLNTGAAIAGLKPWSKDWVFEGRPDASGKAVEPLFASKDAEQKWVTELLHKFEKMNNAGGSKASGRSGQGVNPHDMDPANFDPSALMRGGASGANVGKPSLTVDPAFVNAAQISGMSEFNDMNGSIETFEGVGPGIMEAVEAKNVRPAGPGGTSALSGSEFLTTLGAVQNEKSQGDRSNSDQSMSRDMGARPELRPVEGGLKGKSKKLNFGDALGAQAGVEALGRRPILNGEKPVRLVTGHVTQGSMTRERLSSESLLGISSGIRELKAQGGGEIRIRLKPENLGELHLRVVTQGNNVGLQIHASDERAKKIIEETMKSLKDSLAGQNLNLAKVELSVASLQQAAAGDMNNRNQDQGQGQGMLGQNAGHEGSNGNGQRWDAVDQDRIQSGGSYRSRQSGAAGMTVASAQPGRSTSANGRIDLMA